MLNSNQIQDLIPHRYPFLLVDKVSDISDNKIIGHKAVSANEMHFVGHFAHHHVMPGVLIVESLAQVGCVWLMSQEQYKGKLAFFAKIDKCKFKRQVVPGDVLDLHVEMVKIRGSIGIGEAKAYVGDELACSATLTFALSDV